MKVSSFLSVNALAALLVPSLVGSQQLRSSGGKTSASGWGGTPDLMPEGRADNGAIGDRSLQSCPNGPSFQHIDICPIGADKRVVPFDPDGPGPAPLGRYCFNAGNGFPPGSAIGQPTSSIVCKKLIPGLVGITFWAHEFEACSQGRISHVTLKLYDMIAKKTITRRKEYESQYMLYENKLVNNVTQYKSANLTDGNYEVSAIMYGWDGQVLDDVSWTLTLISNC